MNFPPHPRSWWGFAVALPRSVLATVLNLYRRVVSPLYGQVCRYFPTCSAYALEAVVVHGAVKGSWLTLRRVTRCHPWAAGGPDDVPLRRDGRRLVGPTYSLGNTQPGIMELNHPVIENPLFDSGSTPTQEPYD